MRIKENSIASELHQNLMMIILDLINFQIPCYCRNIRIIEKAVMFFCAIFFKYIIRYKYPSKCYKLLSCCAAFMVTAFISHLLKWKITKVT